MAATTGDKLKIKVEFSGGLELIFGNQRAHNIEIPAVVDGNPADVTYLIEHLRLHHLKERPELFAENKTV